VDVRAAIPRQGRIAQFGSMKWRNQRVTGGSAVFARSPILTRSSIECLGADLEMAASG